MYKKENRFVEYENFFWQYPAQLMKEAVDSDIADCLCKLKNCYKAISELITSRKVSKHYTVGPETCL